MNKSLENIWRERFSRFAERYNEDHLIAGWSKEGLQIRLKIYLDFFKSLNLSTDSYILDLGCGAGTYCRTLRKLGYNNIVGLDYSYSVLKKAKMKSNSVYYLNGDIYNLPFQKNIFDHVVCIGVFQTLTLEQYALVEIKRVLKSGGYLIISFLNSSEIFYKITELFKNKINNKFLRRYHKKYFVNLLKRIGFEVERIEYICIFPQKYNFFYKFPKIIYNNSLMAHSILILCYKKK